MKNKQYIQINPDVKILLTLFCFQEEIYQKNSSNYETPKIIKSEKNIFYAIKKSIMEKYKKFYNYEILYNFFKKKNNKVLDCIKNNKIIDSQKLVDREILYEIIPQLPVDFTNKINNIDKNNKNKLIEEIENEDKKEWNCKMIKYEDNNLCLELINDFEIISYELFLYLETQDIKLTKFFVGSYFIGNKKIFINWKGLNKIFYEIGQIKEDGNFIIEYLFNPKEISNTRFFNDDLNKLGLKELYKQIAKKKDIVINKKTYKIYKVDIKKITENIEDTIQKAPENNNNSIRNKYKNNKNINSKDSNENNKNVDNKSSNQANKNLNNNLNNKKLDNNNSNKNNKKKI